MGVTQASLQRLHDNVDIVDLINHYINVRKSGANFMALCPFHDDKTPSMSISQQKGLYHCHACGASGNAIKFVMEYERLEFQDALQKIANLFNITLEYEQGNFKKKSNLLPTLTLFYHNKLFKHQDIYQYLTSRGINEDSIKKFELGYSGMSYETIKFLDEHHYDYNEALECGIISQGNDRAYAKFTNRIIFPIHSGNGVVVGFGGRTLSEEKNIAKYLNSPQSKIFNKSKILYGYHLARQAIYKEKYLIVCEGYIDVIMLHQAGFKNTVATLGTALNEGHLHLLNKDNPRILMCYDGDVAGINAAFKAAKFLSQNSKDGGVILLKNGLDPADMILQNKINEFQHELENAKNFVEFVLEKIISEFDINNPIQKEQALKLCLEYLHSLSPLLQDEYRRKCAILLQVDPIYITTKRMRKQELIQPHTYKDSHDYAEENILINMLKSSEYFFFALNFLDKKHFRKYAHEFELITQGKQHDELIIALQFKSNVQNLQQVEFEEQIRIFLLKYAKETLQNTLNNTTLNGNEKIQNIIHLRNAIQKLEKGEILTI
ncbi:DNA primase [Helicobacter didelphidarum]|uniref:DNA primase n=1 Tax=Helicobacter didelphidarum TaxID=2040648 RepID=A0A3D8IPS8_9HELI|nr:DNA primase [Helicobacter didelphidarum]RDU67103.1 DNA primase [Helicobacter didelphidarum]